jgi:hypothetical protein
VRQQFLCTATTNFPAVQLQIVHYCLTRVSGVNRPRVFRSWLTDWALFACVKGLACLAANFRLEAISYPLGWSFVFSSMVCISHYHLDYHHAYTVQCAIYEIVQILVHL